MNNIICCNNLEYIIYCELKIRYLSNMDIAICWPYATLFHILSLLFGPEFKDRLSAMGEDGHDLLK